MTSQVKIVLLAALAIETHWMKQRARRPRSRKIPGISGWSVEPAQFDQPERAFDPPPGSDHSAGC
jgi:hypothetical protein